jgi:hypothetical protein
MKALFGNRREQGFFICEMTVGSGVGYTGSARGLTQRDAGRAKLVDELERGIYQCAAEITVMISPAFVGHFRGRRIRKLLRARHDSNAYDVTTAMAMPAIATSKLQV